MVGMCHLLGLALLESGSCTSSGNLGGGGWWAGGGSPGTITGPPLGGGGTLWLGGPMYCWLVEL